MSILVLGSLNMDFVVTVEHLPAAGQTVLGQGFRMLPGGKGANQACAAGRMAAGRMLVRMAGRVGDDVFGEPLRASLVAAHVDHSLVLTTYGAATGTAFIEVDAEGQNTIVVASGANFQVTASDAEALESELDGVSSVLLQLETPLEAVEALLRLCAQRGVRTILDPAPAQQLHPQLLSLVDVLTPNETEACLLLGRTPGRIGRDEAVELAYDLLTLGPDSVVLKLGGQGCLYTDGNTEHFVPALPVKPVDTTAAGDVWNGSFAVALAEGRELAEAMRFATAAAALSVTRVGAQASIPSRAEVDALL